MSKLKKALEKAREERSERGQSNISEIKTISSSDSDSLTSKEKTSQGEIHVKYNQTKVENVLPSTFKRNRIFSLYQEHEMTDEVKMLRTQIINKLKEINGNTLLITSANPGEGKTFLTINLGVSIVQHLERTVLMVDADLRNPSKRHKNFSNDFFGIEIVKGLSDYLLGQAEISDILVNPGIERLTILPAGKPLSNSAELLGSTRMEALANDIRNRYRSDRIVLIDSPSLLCTDPIVLSHYVDGILLVVEDEKTSADDIKRMMELLKDKPVVGTVLNKAKSEVRAAYV
jgi:non-specific protein-tyrosine kinase